MYACIVSVYVYVYVCAYVCVYIYIYIYIYGSFCLSTVNVEIQIRNLFATPAPRRLRRDGDAWNINLSLSLSLSPPLSLCLRSYTGRVLVAYHAAYHAAASVSTSASTRQSMRFRGLRHVHYYCYYVNYYHICAHIYIYMHLCIYIYVVRVCVCIYIYIYINENNNSPSRRPAGRPRRRRDRCAADRQTWAFDIITMIYISFERCNAIFTCNNLSICAQLTVKRGRQSLGHIYIYI